MSVGGDGLTCVASTAGGAGAARALSSTLASLISVVMQKVQKPFYVFAAFNFFCNLMLRVRSVVSLVRASHTAAATREEVKSLQREATKNTVSYGVLHGTHTTHANGQPNKRGQSAGKKFMLARINGILSNTTVGVYQNLNLNAGMHSTCAFCNHSENHARRRMGDAPLRGPQAWTRSTSGAQQVDCCCSREDPVCEVVGRFVQR